MLWKMGMCSTAWKNLRGMGNSAGASWRICRPVRASRWMSVSIIPWILRFGKLPSRESRVGTVRGDAVILAGILNVRRCLSSIWGKRLISMAAEVILFFRIMRMKSLSRRHALAMITVLPDIGCIMALLPFTMKKCQNPGIIFLPLKTFCKSILEKWSGSLSSRRIIAVRWISVTNA